MSEYVSSDDKPQDNIQDSISATLSNAVRQHPLPTALIGMGLIWLMSGRTARQQDGKLGYQTGADRLPDFAADVPDKGRRALKSGYDTMVDTASDARSALAQGGDALMDRAGNAGSATGSGVKQAVTQLQDGFRDNFDASRTFESARSKVADLLEQQPLLLGIVGLAVGAGLAAAVPPTQLEKELLGEASESFMQKARDFSSEHMGQAGQIASSFVESAKDEAKAQLEGALKGN